MGPLKLAIALAATGCLTAPPQTLCSGEYQTPILIPTVNTGANEEAPFLTRDRLELVFTRYGNASSSIYHSTRSSPTDAWSAPTQLAFSTPTDLDENPFVTSDGSTLWFTSMNRSGGTLFTIDRMVAHGDFVGLPQPVDVLGQNGGAMSLTDDQLDIYYNSPFPQTDTTLVYTQHRASKAVPFPNPPAMGTLVTGLDDGDTQKLAPSISADGGTLMYTTSPSLANYLSWRADRVGPAAFANVHKVLVDGAFDASFIDDTVIVFSAPLTGDNDLFSTERSCP